MSSWNRLGLRRGGDATTGGQTPPDPAGTPTGARPRRAGTASRCGRARSAPPGSGCGRGIRQQPTRSNQCWITIAVELGGDLAQDALGSALRHSSRCPGCFQSLKSGSICQRRGPAPAPRDREHSGGALVTNRVQAARPGGLAHSGSGPRVAAGPDLPRAGPPPGRGTRTASKRAARRRPRPPASPPPGAAAASAAPASRQASRRRRRRRPPFANAAARANRRLGRRAPPPPPNSNSPGR